MSVQEIESAIHRLSPAEVEELRAWIDNYVEAQRKSASAGGRTTKHRSLAHVRSLSGKWIGEPVLKSGDLAEEMFARE